MKARVADHMATERQRYVTYVRSLLREDPDLDPEDIVQDVALTLLERSDMPAPERLVAYIYRALKHRVIDRFRTRKRTVPFDDELAVGPGRLDPLELTQTEQGREALFRALAELGDVEREVLIAHEFEGIPFKTLAERWQTPIGTLLSHKARALAKLKRNIER